MFKYIFQFTIIIMLNTALAFEVQNVVATQSTDGEHVLTVSYDLTGDDVFVSFEMHSEISIDGGETWEEAEIWASDSSLTWSLWKYRWQVPQKAGRIEIYARAIANDGLIQSETGFDAKPVGAVGYHTVVVEVIQ